jgi:PPM family protein phosphatase
MPYLAASAQHIGGRGEQQDAYAFSHASDEAFLRHGGFLALLADGMGGMAHGRQASATGIQTFLAAYLRKAPSESIPRALLRSLHEANDAVYHLSQQLGAPGQVGSTFVAAVLHGSQLEWVTVGDSQLYLLRDGALHVLSTSHTYAQFLDRAAAEGKISRDEALHDAQREALTSYLGIETLTEIDLSQRPVPLQDRDRVVLASDGLFKTLTAQEIAQSLRGPDPQRDVDMLIRLTIEKQRSYQDNVTVLCVEFSGPVEQLRTEDITTRVDPPTLVPGTPAAAPILESPPSESSQQPVRPTQPPDVRSTPKRRRWWLPF